MDGSRESATSLVKIDPAQERSGELDALRNMEIGSALTQFVTFVHKLIDTGKSFSLKDLNKFMSEFEERIKALKEDDRFQNRLEDLENLRKILES
mmetsp:Transcript_43796/g.50373  ORF Transcript_43796/g.50373 Transcript_43796/m.50373 type:complete len:95 (-) Transcript_43796:32-316(-)